MRKNVALAAACIGLLICASYLFNLRYLYAAANIDTKLMELELNTVKDFTIQGKISKACYLDYLQNVDTHSEIADFKESLENALRAKLHSLQGLDPSETNIVDIQFAFNNTKLLKLLTKRSKALEKADFEKQRQIED